MSDEQKVPWLRLGLEAVAIVGSILLAFAIDAWWDAATEEQRERELLESLLDDFRRSKDDLAEFTRFHTAVQASNEKLLQASITRDEELSEKEVDRLLLDLSWWDSANHFATSTLNSVIFGGELTLIQDDEMRRDLAEWPKRIEFVQGVQRQDYDFFSGVWMPFLRENAYLAQITVLDAHMPGRPGIPADTIDLKIEETRKHSDMIASDEFQNLLVTKHWIQSDILSTFAATEELLDSTIEQIEAQLNK